MPVIVNEDETDIQYMCDICGVEIQDQTEGTRCPTCGRILGKV
jgi:DNA-directed RNA polymerase subunit RPC12/RpoP